MININTKYIYIIGSAIGILLAGGLFLFLIRPPIPKDVVIVTGVEEQFEGAATEAVADIEAKSAIVVNLRTGEILIKKDLSLSVPIASITKVATAIVSLKHINSDDIVQIKKEDFAVEGGSSLKEGEVWSAYDLLKYALITSSNEAVNAIARTVSEKKKEPFALLLNEFVKNNRLYQTHFVNPSGLDIHAGLSGSESSASDTATLFKIFYERYPVFAQETTYSEKTFYTQNGVSYTAKNTNPYVDEMVGIRASKTGFTGRAGGNLGVVIRTNPDPLIVVVLGSTREGRFSDVRKLIEQAKGLFPTTVQQSSIVRENI